MRETINRILFGAALAAVIVAGTFTGLTGPTADPQYKYSTPMPPGVAIPDKVETRLGTLRFDIGSDTGTPVDDADYQIPFAFTGKLDKLTLSLGRANADARGHQTARSGDTEQQDERVRNR